MSRVFNFSAGPAALPEEVLAQARVEMLDWNGSGMSVMEMSHRSPEFVGIAEKAERDLRELLDVPDDYAVLWMQGGATLQFAGTLMNLTAPGDAVDYAITGSWSKKAAGEATAFCNVSRVVDTEASGYTTVPSADQWTLNSDAKLLHVCLNETIGGVEISDLPDAGSVPIVADVSSTILSRPLAVERFGVLYAGAQKNIGPAGLTLVIVRRDLLGNARADTPSVMNYAQLDAKGSMLNTPPTYTWYLAGLVFQWLKAQGGLEAMERRNRAKKDSLYAQIDGSEFYASPVATECRSWMNIPFTLADSSLDKSFLEGARSAGLVNLKGHRSVGGMRASIYNAMPQAGVDALIEVMREFERHNG